MKKQVWRSGFRLVCVLLLGLGLAAGCGGDDDAEAAAADAAADAADGGDGGTLETNVVATTNGDGSVTLITNLVFVPNPITNFTLKLPAPAVIGPADGVSWVLQPGAQGATVKFEWAVVTGADGYQVAYKRPTDSAFKTMNAAASPAYGQYPRGTNFWRVAAVVNGTPQTWSATRSFIFK